MKTCGLARVFIGVDVSKEKLDIYVPRAREGARSTEIEVDNNIDGFKQLRELARKVNATVCVEPTGGYELELIAFMHKFDISVAYTDALRVRQFARAEGTLSKNDRIDAALISRFAEKIGVRELDKQDIDAVELKRKVKFRQTLINVRTAMICRLETEIDDEMKDLLEKQVKHLTKLITKAEQSCIKAVEKNESTNSLRKRFVQVSGVGDLTAISILAGLPEIGKLSDEKLSRLAGIAPVEKQSGKKEYRRTIWGGRKDVRNALYMATTACIIWNSKLSTYYHKKRAEGNFHKWCMVPTMRKLLSLLNRIARDPTFVPAPEPESTKKNANVGRKKKVA